MPNRNNFWVSPRPNGWAVKNEGAGRAAAVKGTQAEAWKLARRLAKERRGEAFLKGRDNKIRERNTYGHDPYPPRG